MYTSTDIFFLDRREREAQDLELAKEMAEEDDDLM